MDYAEWFPERLAQLRMDRNVSARDMSLSLGQSESYINKIENRRTMPSMSGFFYICEYLGVTPQEFFSMENISPAKSNELIQQIQRLPADQCDHILQIVKDLNSK